MILDDVTGAPVPPQLVACAEGTCCSVVNASFSISGTYFFYFNAAILMVTFVSVVVLLMSLSFKRQEYVAGHFNWVMLNCLTFFVVEMVHWFPVPNQGAWPVIQEYFELGLFMMQWFCQMGIVFFMMEKTVCPEAERWSYIRSGIVTFLFGCLGLADIVAGSQICGFIIEVLMTIFFALAILLHYSGQRCGLANHPITQRTGIVPWSSYQCIAHWAFSAQFLFSKLSDETDNQISMCTLIINNVFYYGLYAVFFYITVRIDNKFAKKLERHASFMHSFSQTDGNSAHNSSALLSTSFITIDPSSPPRSSQSSGQYLKSDSSIRDHSKHVMAFYNVSGGASGPLPSSVVSSSSSSVSSSVSSAVSSNPSSISSSVLSPSSSMIYHEGPSHSHIRQIKFDELIIEGLSGEGRHGEVYKALWRGTTVAVKRFKPLHGPNMGPKLLESLMKEANFLNELRHPNVVLLIGVSLESPNFSIITEYLQRGSLFDAIHSKIINAFHAKPHPSPNSQLKG